MSPPQIIEPVQPSGPDGRILTSSTSRRIGLFSSLVMILLGILVVRLWFLQVVGTSGFEETAVGNSVRTINIPAPRGDILDRRGRVLATTREAWDVVALPQDVTGEEGKRTLARIARVIDVKAELLERRIARGEKRAAYKSVVLLADLAETDPLFLALNERIHEFPGIRLERNFRRDYVNEAYLSHVLGYVGQIPEENYEKYKEQGYRNDAIVGITGLEAKYERFLRGVDGERRVEVDAAGQPTGRNILSERPAKPGNTLTTSIDIDVQKVLDDAITEEVLLRSEFNGGGGGVVLDIQTGEVIAMSSFPQKDPALFTRGRKAEIQRYQREWKARNYELNRAVWALPPASTFKPITAIVALNAGVLSPDEYLTSPKQLRIGGTVFRNFRGVELPDMTVRPALMFSSDTFFYQVGHRIHNQAKQPARRDGDNKLKMWSQALGFGRPTGVDLPQEYAGVLPDRAWKRGAEGLIEARNAWRPGDTINMSIGQGYLGITPIQLARAYAAIVSTDHRLRTPTIGKQIVDRDDVNNEILDVARGTRTSDLPAFNPGVLEPVTGGLYDATNNSQGTAQPVFAKVPGLVAGKTGTAESGVRIVRQKGADGTIRRVQVPKRDHSWFVGYGPVSGTEPPKYVVAVAIEHAGLGGISAAPAACKALLAALQRNPGDCREGRQPTTTSQEGD